VVKLRNRNALFTEIKIPYEKYLALQILHLKVKFYMARYITVLA